MCVCVSLSCKTFAESFAVVGEGPLFHLGCLSHYISFDHLFLSHSVELLFEDPFVCVCADDEFMILPIFPLHCLLCSLNRSNDCKS